jgi:hypothetical protein
MKDVLELDIGILDCISSDEEGRNLGLVLISSLRRTKTDYNDRLAGCELEELMTQLDMREADHSYGDCVDYSNREGHHNNPNPRNA